MCSDGRKNTCYKDCPTKWQLLDYFNEKIASVRQSTGGSPIQTSNLDEFVEFEEEVSDIFVHKLILVLVFIPFGLHNFRFHSISEIILVLVFIQFYKINFSFYLFLVLILKFSKLQQSNEIIRSMGG